MVQNQEFKGIKGNSNAESRTLATCQICHTSLGYYPSPNLRTFVQPTNTWKIFWKPLVPLPPTFYAIFHHLA